MSGRAEMDSQPRAPGPPRQSPAFRRLWAGQSVSVLGSQVTVLALPLAAVLVLHASTFQVGVLTTVETAAFLVIGLPAGAWVDRGRRLPVMMVADGLRALALASVPVAYALGALTLVQLYVVALVQGVGTVFFDVAYMSFLPGLVGRHQLVDANAKLQASASVAQVCGPALSGVLVGLFSAPIAFLADAASFVVSVGSLAALPGPEPAPERPEKLDLRAEIAEGLRLVLDQPALRMIAGATATGNFFLSAFSAISVVFLVRQVGLSPASTGLLASAGAVGGLVGALSSPWLRRRVGPRRIIWVAAVATYPFGLLVPLTSRGAGTAFYVAGLGVVSLGIVVYNINQASFRQLLCPPRLLGRMNATMRFIVWGTQPIGGLLGAALGAWAGTRAAIWVSMAGTALSPLWLLASPLARGYGLDDHGEGEAPAPGRGPGAGLRR